MSGRSAARSNSSTSAFPAFARIRELPPPRRFHTTRFGETGRRGRLPLGEINHGYDLIVLPLSFEGDRDALYDRPPARTVIVHDWLWRKRGISGIVSVVLLKRLNLVRG